MVLSIWRTQQQVFNSRNSQKKHYKPVKISLHLFKKYTVQKYEELLLLNENDHRKSLHRIKYSHIPDENDGVRDVYQHILKVHNYSSEIFSEKTRNFLSEQDYIIKVLGLSYWNCISLFRCNSSLGWYYIILLDWKWNSCQKWTYN